VTAPKAARRGATAKRGLPNEVRIVGGLWKRSKLPVFDKPGLRPTPQRVRETLFNWLGQDLTGWRCLDAFAGSGALGFEAASRGAADVLMLERDPQLVASLRATAMRLKANAVRVERADALAWMRTSPAAAFDLILLDPPFDAPWRPAALRAAAELLRTGGYLYLEAPVTLTDLPAAMEVWRKDRAGAVHYHVLRRNS
jgi:16S rRNA (guanine(966)-N(2))-methyltransferase RsmD